MGSSTARGALVNYQDSFAALAGDALTRDCRQIVDFQNLGTEAADMGHLDERTEEALALKPAAIVITVGPYDLSHLMDRPAAETADDDGGFNLATIVSLLRESRLFLVTQYYLYRDPEFQISAFLLKGDTADSVRMPLTAAWRGRVADFGAVLARIAAKTEPAHVPVDLFYVPDRPQAALAAETSDPPGIDPYGLGRALGEEAARHGVGFTDTTRSFAVYPDFASLFYLTDGHPAVGGHAALAGDVVTSLLAEPGFASCKAPSTVVVESNLR
jgi:hypothetical protein